VKILAVLKTTGVQYDDRFRKESETLASLGHEVHLAVVESANRSREVTTEQGVHIRAYSLATRRWFAQSRGLALKTFEMYLRALLRLVRIRPDVLWLHNEEMAGLVPAGWVAKKAGLIRRIVWDQHELPAEAWLRGARGPRLMRWLLRCCDAVLVANEERRDHLLGRLGGESDRFYVLDNLCDRRFQDLPPGVLPGDVEAWLGGDPYVLAQGGGVPGRHLAEVVEAVMGTPGVKLVVVGPYDAAQVEDLRRHWGGSFDRKVRFPGTVPQMELVRFIDGALAGIVLYGAIRPNNELCAPNRLYQALARGVPVVVGANPPMKRIVSRWECGVVLEGDGRDAEDVRRGIAELLARREALRENARKTIGQLQWESQVGAIQAALGAGG